MKKSIFFSLCIISLILVECTKESVSNQQQQVSSYTASNLTTADSNHIQAYQNANPAGPYGFNFSFDDINAIKRSDKTATGVRVMLAYDDNGVLTAYLVASHVDFNATQANTLSGSGSGGTLPCPTYCK